MRPEAGGRRSSRIETAASGAGPRAASSSKPANWISQALGRRFRRFRARGDANIASASAELGLRHLRRCACVRRRLPARFADAWPKPRGGRVSTVAAASGRCFAITDALFLPDPVSTTTSTGPPVMIRCSTSSLRISRSRRLPSILACSITPMRGSGRGLKNNSAGRLAADVGAHPEHGRQRQSGHDEHHDDPID